MKFKYKIIPLVIALSTALVLSTCVENHVLPSFAKLFISSNPLGAEIHLNDKNTGKVTPDSLTELLSGAYKITLKYPAYNDSTINVNLEDNQIVNLNVALTETNPEGLIVVNSDPIGAQILLNGNETGSVTPDSVLALLREDHEISLGKEGFIDTTFQVSFDDKVRVEYDIFMSESNPQGEITITSQPSGASISINGESTGEITPHTFSGMERGIYEIGLTLDLYEDTSFLLTLDKDQQVSRDTRMIIAGTAGSIFVDSDPQGASILLDDFDTGLFTPDTIKPLAPGNYQIRLSLNEFLDTTFTASVTTGNMTIENVFLTESNPQGEITLTSEPSGASISLNGSETGQLTPATLTNLPRGSYEIGLQLDLFENASFTIELDKDEKVSRNTKLIISGSSGSIFITSTPPGAQIFVDADNTGLVTPDTVKPLAPGEYDVTLSLQDYRDTTITSQVSQGEVTNENVVMTIYEPRGSITLDSNPQGATIFLDSINTGEVTPSILRKIEAGTYEIRLELAEYFDSTFTVEVIQDQNTNVPVVDLVLIPFIINVDIFPENSGTVTGAGAYNPGESVSLQAVPNPGYNFLNWTEDGDEISTDPVIFFNAERDRDLVANFQLNVYQISVTTDPEDAGFIEGAGFYQHGDRVNLSVTANDNYVFVQWTEEDNILSTEPSYSFTATSDRNLVAEFDGLGNLSVSSDPFGANITLNGEPTNENTPHEFTDLVEGTYSVKLDLQDFADTTIITQVFTGQTTDLGSVYLTDTTSAVEVSISYQVNPINQRINFFFVFNQDIRFNRVEVTNPEGRFIQWPFNDQLFPEGIAANVGFPEKIEGTWSFRCIGAKVGGRQDSFDISQDVTVE